MALFKIFKGDGSAKALPTTKTDGFCYFTYNDGKFYVDYADASGTLQRRALNAAQADSAAKLTTARQVIIEGAVDGSVSSWNGSKDLRISVALNTTWADKINDSYAHAVTNKGSAFAAGLYKITTNAEGHVIAATAVTKSDITALGIPSTNTTYSVMSGASSSADGTAGLVPQPIKGQQNYFLAGNGSWAVPTNTTYGLSGQISGNTFVATLGAASTGTTATIPEATADTAGLMTSAMVSKLAGIASGANKYVLPTASTTLGGVKTTSTVASTSGLTASPIISGVVYYKDTTYGAATTSAAGLMSAADKSKLDSISADANKYTLPVATDVTLGGIKAGGDITIDSTGVVSVKDDSHSHVISNVDGLSDAIQGAKDYADTAVANLVGSAPETLNTLEELARAINNSPDVMTAINNSIATKQDKITGAATTITSANLTANRALVSNGDGKVAVSAVTATELGYLDGVTGAIQTQLNAKVATGSAEYIKGLSISGRTITYTKGDGTTGTLTTQDNNTTYKAGTGLTLSSGTFNHTNAVTAATGVGEDGATRTLAFGGTFKVPTVSYDAQGHITGSGTVTLTMPANPNTDTQVKMTNTDPSAEGNWYLLGSSVATTSTDSVLKNNDLRIKVKNGTADTTGYVTLLLGNSTASGTAGNKYGQLLLFSSNTGYHTIVGASTTSTISHTLPAASGTLINTGNYTSYTVKKDGTGASGDWGINITGRAYTIKDSQSDSTITITYAKAGQSSTSWLASWNGYELGAISPANITAGKATQLATARSIFGRSFNGTADIAGKATMYGTYNSTASSRYNYTALEIRENGLVTNNQSDIGYAPQIGFHWGGRVAATFLLHSDGNFYLRKQDGVTRASLDANLIGNAATATVAATLGKSGDITGPMKFYWSGQSGQPSWLWGGSDGTNMYVYNPSNFSVNYATSAGSAAKVNNVIPEWAGSIAWADTSWIAAWNADGTKIKALSKGSFAAASHTHNYAGSSSAGGAANSANVLNINNTASLGNCLQYIQTSSQTTGNDLPTATWWHVLKMNHGTGDTYYKRLLAFNFFSSEIKTSYAAGDGAVNAWKKVWIEGDSITGAVWNDYAEYRESDCSEPGRVLIEKGDDTLTMSTEHMQPFAGIVSDTWGFCQGETETAKTPIAVAGRVLVYTNQDRNTFKPGDVVCAGPNGTVEKMSRNEIIQFPDRIVGTVSCVPEYETWGSGDRDPVQVNGRIWIKVR